MIPIKIKELQKATLFIATPMYGSACFGPYVESLMGYSILARQYNLHFEVHFHYNESLIQRARNYLVDTFLRSECTHLLFIDADIQFDPVYVLTLLATNKDVICGLYPKKQIIWNNIKAACDNKEEAIDLPHFSTNFAFNLLPGTKEIEITEPLEVMEGATGFMMIKRNVFDRFKEAYPESLYTPDDSSIGGDFSGDRKINAYFDCMIDPVSNRYLSEDYYFSHKVRQLGIKIWACPWMQLGHVGTHMFQGDIRALASIGKSLS